MPVIQLFPAFKRRRQEATNSLHPGRRKVSRPQSGEVWALGQRFLRSQILFMDNPTDMTFLKRMIGPIVVALMVIGLQPCVGTVNSDVYLRLQSSRDALLTQERDISKSYDEVTRQIDVLRERQALLDSYLAQTRAAIRDVERAMQ